ncbi:SIMPL domain-containing protein [Methylobacterium nigriterrae]|uniref:SIMPL domain-containing protein n=1 Tax=Methylobacterium nigriterrae TaxID=3127512 RepID=UPI003D67A747
MLLLACAAGPTRAEDAPALADGLIQVVGRARSETAPDFASVEIGIEARGATPAAALDATSEAARKVIALAAGFGVGEADIGTTAVTLEPVTRTVRQPDGSVTERQDGYRAANRVSLRLADMGRLGELMRRALDAGANRIEGVAFGLKDPEAAESAVRVAAMKDASAQAARLAEAAGVRLGRVVSIQSPPRIAIPPVLMAAAAPMRAKGRGGVPVPLVAGTIGASAEVAATFAIAP